MRLDLGKHRFCQAAKMSELMTSKCCFNLSKGRGALTHNTETTAGGGGGGGGMVSLLSSSSHSRCGL